MMCDIFIRCYFLYLLGTTSSVRCTKSADKYWKCDEKTGEQVCVATRRGHNCSTCIKDHYPVEGSPDCKYCTETNWYTCTDKGERECKDNWYGAMCDEYCVETERFSCLGTGAIQCKTNFTGEESYCGSCKEDHYGVSCDVACVPLTTLSVCDVKTGALKCKEGYFNPPYCNTFCNTSSPYYTCNPSGEKQCGANRDINAGCDTCVENWFGEECGTFCFTDLVTMECDVGGGLVCKQGWDGVECMECAEGWHGNMCDNFCVDLEDFRCDSEGILVMLNELGTDLRDVDYNSDHHEDNDVVYASFLIIFGFLAALFSLFISYLFYRKLRNILSERQQCKR